MKGAWWVDGNELIEEQREVVALPADGDFLILGPPGSGKTNLLVLRANFLARSGLQNLLILTFNRTLREFIASGANNYDFPPQKVSTYASWQGSFLWEQGVEAVKENDEGEALGFAESRARRREQIEDVVSERGIANSYSAILVDEAQDYTPEELRLFSSLSERLFLVADSRQQIYKGNAEASDLMAVVTDCRELKHHHRCGRMICRVADGLTKDQSRYRPLVETSNYDEKSAPSTVDVRRCGTLDGQVRAIIERIETQLKAYPAELIGVLVPKPMYLEPVWSVLQESSFANQCAVQKQGEYVPFEDGKQIYLSTIHSAKGCEFRCVHIAMAESIKKVPLQRNAIFTATTRARTALSFYHIDDLPGYLEQALDNALNPHRSSPSVDDLFGGSS